jgi:hypothetical protein
VTIPAIPFTEFPKIPRLRRGCVISEKIDGTNASVLITEDGGVFAGSRTRWITPEADNHGFAAWVRDHADQLRGLGVGLHFGEWWGQGIQRRYGLDHKRFSLFNSGRWNSHHPPPDCCHVVPVVRGCAFNDGEIQAALETLRTGGSLAAPGFMRPEGIVVFHPASKHLFKVTLDNDDEPKAVVQQREKQASEATGAM